MILENIKIYSQNVYKNNFIINTILETYLSFDIIFIQEPSWSVIRSILIYTNCKGEELVGVPNHPNWFIFFRNSSQVANSLKVITYINICISSLHFPLWNNILNHRDISCIYFFNCGSIFNQYISWFVSNGFEVSQGYWSQY